MKKPRRKKDDRRRTTAEVMDLIDQERHRAAILFFLEEHLNRNYLGKGPEPPSARIPVNGLRVPPRRDVVESLRSEIVVACLVTGENVRLLLAGEADWPTLRDHRLFVDEDRADE